MSSRRDVRLQPDQLALGLPEDAPREASAGPAPAGRTRAAAEDEARAAGAGPEVLPAGALVAEAAAPLLAPGGPSVESPLDGLTSEQLDAVTHAEGPLLIVAGAGTGKTTVMTRRIGHLITRAGARPEQVLALTFTDRAAAEMEERVDRLVPYGYTQAWISTFHAFGDRVLREHALHLGLPPDFRVLNRAEQAIFIRERLFEFPLDHFRPLGDPARYVDALDRADQPRKGRGRLAGRVRGVRGPSGRGGRGGPGRRGARGARPAAAGARGGVPHVPGSLGQGRAPRLRGPDHADASGCCASTRRRSRATRSSSTTSSWTSSKTPTTRSSNSVKLLAGARRNLTVVADDDQAIYRFRGASYSNITYFTEAYADARTVVLTRNYRSTQFILDAAYRLIRHNDPDRLEVRIGIDKRLHAVAGPGRAAAPPALRLAAARRPTGWPTGSRSASPRARGGTGTSRSWCGPTRTRTRSCARSTCAASRSPVLRRRAASTTARRSAS